MTTALVTLEDARKENALVYINEGHLKPDTPLYKTQETKITLDIKNDVHDIGGKMMPKREAVDRMGEASGISFVSSGCRTWTETRDDSAGKRTVFISEQQGKMRMPDGSWRTSAVKAYEFDPNLRAMLDIGVDEWNERTKKQRKTGNDGAAYGKPLAMLAMEYSKHARQRAESGAKLRVIRELTGMPTAFSKEEIKKPMVFSRVVQNTDYLLKTPEGRMLAAAQATGTQDVVAALYGKQLPAGPGADEAAENMRNVTEENSGVDRQPSAEALADAAEGDDDWTRLKPADDFKELSIRLEEYSVGYKDRLNVVLEGNGKTVNPYSLVMNELDNPGATAASRKAMIARIDSFLKNLEEKV
jgi:hypothetical protein